MIGKLKSKGIILVFIVIFLLSMTACGAENDSSDMNSSSDQSVVSTEDASDDEDNLDYYDDEDEEEFDDDEDEDFDDEDSDYSEDDEDDKSISEPAKNTYTAFGKLEIQFLDLGQADGALVICDDKAMLIDGGNRDDSSFMYSYLKEKGISHLDYVIATHPDEDHIGGIAGALNYASCETVYCSTDKWDSYIFDDFKFYVEKQGKKIEVPEPGTTFNLGDAKCKILGPISKSEESNNNSIILRITYGKTSFLFTGDAEFDEEKELIDSGAKLRSNVLKVAHHGSSSSTSSRFLKKVKPDYAVISVGKDNSYGHPTEKILKRLKKAGAKIYRTDKKGTITCISDGKSIKFKTEKSSSENDTAVATNSSDVNTYILNTNTHKFHFPLCRSVKDMKEKNKEEFVGSREECIKLGYEPCGNCKP